MTMAGRARHRHALGMGFRAQRGWAMGGSIALLVASACSSEQPATPTVGCTLGSTQQYCACSLGATATTASCTNDTFDVSWCEAPDTYPSAGVGECSCKGVRCAETATSCTCYSGQGDSLEPCYRSGTHDPKKPLTGHCCLNRSNYCGCHAQTCLADETEVEECSPKFLAARAQPRPGMRLVNFCLDSSGDTPRPESPSPTPGGTCADKGFCGPSTDRCACGTSCIHAGVGSYLCGVSCSSDAQCAGKKDPQTGESFTRCTAALDTPTMTYGRFCN